MKWDFLPEKEGLCTKTITVTTVGAAVTGTGGIWGAVTRPLGSIFSHKKLNETFELTVLATIIEARLKAEQQKG